MCSLDLPKQIGILAYAPSRLQFGSPLLSFHLLKGISIQITNDKNGPDSVKSDMKKVCASSPKRSPEIDRSRIEGNEIDWAKLELETDIPFYTNVREWNFLHRCSPLALDEHITLTA
jgi:hypothetical protein